MVGLVILYDHVHPQGAFVKGSNVDVSSWKNIKNMLYLEVAIENISIIKNFKWFKFKEKG